MHDLPEVLTTLEGLPDLVDRHTVAQTVNTELAAGRVLSGYVAAMVWGWGSESGRGAVRTRWTLTGASGSGANIQTLPVDESVALKLKEGAETVRRLGAAEGFRTMNNQSRIKHLGPSYFTKWLYFSSAADDPEGLQAAPILDERIIEWLGETQGIWFKAGSTSAYADYVQLLTIWGAEFGRTPVQVETEVFRLSTGRG